MMNDKNFKLTEGLAFHIKIQCSLLVQFIRFSCDVDLHLVRTFFYHVTALLKLSRECFSCILLNAAQHGLFYVVLSYLLLTLQVKQVANTGMNHNRGQPHLITHHADRQHPVDDRERNDYCVANQPFALSEFLPANQVALRTKQNVAVVQTDRLAIVGK